MATKAWSLVTVLNSFHTAPLSSFLRRARPTHFVAIQLKSREIQRCVLLPQLCWWVWKRASSASMRNFGRAFDSFYTLSNLFHIWHLASKGTVAAMVRCSKQAFWAVFGGMLSTMSLELREGSPPENMCKTSQSVFFAEPMNSHRVQVPIKRIHTALLLTSFEAMTWKQHGLYDDMFVLRASLLVLKLHVWG